ncbi:MAG: ATP-binding protein [Acidobacteria bacterium]|nr:ATP-binding protein [Acidobacteriota bacterium]
MIVRRFQAAVRDSLRHLPAVALLGPRQVGKTTLAHAVAGSQKSVYLDLESPLDREKLSDPTYYLLEHRDHLVIIDEVQRMPELFAILRGLIDRGRREGKKTGRFLLLGSASVDLLRQSETLAGRIAYIELPPFDVLDLPASKTTQLWVRGGFPESYLARNDGASVAWRHNFIRTYLERDIPQLGPRIPATTLQRFWTMLAHVQGGLFNAAQLARGLAVDGKTIARYLDLMVDLMLVRRIQPFQANIGKRLVKSPKVYVRDSGILHALLNIGDRESLLGHPIVGSSWEGFVIENLIAAAPSNMLPMFYRTAVGAEIDLLFEHPRHGLWAIEIKRGLSSNPERSFYAACEDLKPAKRFLVNAGSERRALDRHTEAIGLQDLANVIAAL